MSFFDILPDEILSLIFKDINDVSTFISLYSSAENSDHYKLLLENMSLWDNIMIQALGNNIQIMTLWDLNEVTYFHVSTPPITAIFVFDFLYKEQLYKRGDRKK